MRTNLLAGAAVLLAAGAAFAAPGGLPSDGSGRPNVLFIVCDTLRADYLSCYGYSKLTTPNIDRLLAARGVRFENAVAQVPLTGPSHAVMFTSRHPQENGCIRNGVPLGKGVATLAQILKGEGYATAAFVSGWTLVPRMAGLDRGFDVYDAGMTQNYKAINSMRPGEETTPLALAWLRQQARRSGESFFLFVHYFDPHAPYQEHREFQTLEDNPSASPRWKDYAWQQALNLKDAKGYAGEVAYADAQVGSLLRELQTLELDSRTLVVFTADHGESLGEHGYKGHGRKVYQTNLWVPLILRYDAHLPAPETVSGTVSLMDLAPTILDYAGVKPPKEFRGQNLRPLMERSSPEDRQAALPAREVHRFQTYGGAVGQVPRVLRWLFRQKPATTPVMIGQLEYPYKVIYTPALERMEVYDLSRDPYETENLAGTMTRYREYGDRLVQWIRTTARTFEEPVALSREDEERLRSLGYVQ
jgi:arylsulfatase A-like enzyme